MKNLVFFVITISILVAFFAIGFSSIPPSP